MSQPKITGIIHTRDDASRVVQAIRSLEGFADQIIVADMASTDETRTLAHAAGAQIVHVPDFGFVEPARKIAVAQARNEWVFLLDSDEVLPSSLAAHLNHAVAEDRADAFVLPFLNYFAGRPIRHSGWQPEHDKHLRLFKRGHVDLPDQIHEQIKATPESRVETLDAREQWCVHHFSYESWRHFLVKTNRYTDVEAQAIVDSGTVATPWGITREILRELVWRLFRCGGYRHGLTGWTLSLSMVTYRLVAQSKARQLREFGDEAGVRAHYASVAARLHGHAE